MNVSQLEAALDMPRASIRFYEKEGLLSPERLANGYRDYSEADLETLRRIKLLRALGLPLEDIKALQEGRLRLSDALRAQEARLRREAAEREAARTLCRTMELEGAEYATLDAGRYLEELDKLGETGVTLTPPAADSLPVVRHPWRRYLARALDHSLCVLLLKAILVFTLRFAFGDGVLERVVQDYLAWGIQFLLEPLLLATWGTTPGKWIFGLKVRNAHGGKLTLGEAAARLAVLFRHGEGWGIPIYQLYRNYKSYRACSDGEVLPWDEGRSYAIRDESGLTASMPGYLYDANPLNDLQYLLNKDMLYYSVYAPLARGWGGWARRARRTPGRSGAGAEAVSCRPSRSRPYRISGLLAAHLPVPWPRP